MKVNQPAKIEEDLSDKDSTWVQCEKPTCLKWRKISQEVANSLGDNEEWYCHMNADTNNNTCSATQKEVRCPKGRQFVFSKLDKGTLVWAKLAGYPSWPGVISPDEDNDHLLLDDDGDVIKYHVEFYGKPRTHSWISAKYIEYYGSGNAPKGKEMFSSRTKRNLVHKKTFRAAVTEANAYLASNPEERLKSCVFQPIDKKATPFVHIPVVNSSSNTEKKRKRTTGEFSSNSRKLKKSDNPNPLQQLIDLKTSPYSPIPISSFLQGDQTMPQTTSGQTFVTFPSSLSSSTPSTNLNNVPNIPNNNGMVLLNINGQIVPVILPVLNIQPNTQPVQETKQFDIVNPLSKQCSSTFSTQVFETKGLGMQNCLEKPDKVVNFNCSQSIVSCSQSINDSSKQSKNEICNQVAVTKGKKTVSKSRGGRQKKSATKKPAVHSTTNRSTVKNEISSAVAENINVTRQRPPLGQILKAAYANLFKRRVEEEKQKEKEKSSALLPDPFEKTSKNMNRSNYHMNTPSTTSPDRCSVGTKFSYDFNEYSFKDDDSAKIKHNSQNIKYQTLPGGCSSEKNVEVKCLQSPTKLPFEMLKVPLCTSKTISEAASIKRTKILSHGCNKVIINDQIINLKNKKAENYSPKAACNQTSIPHILSKNKTCNSVTTKCDYVNDLSGKVNYETPQISIVLNSKTDENNNRKDEVGRYALEGPVTSNNINRMDHITCTTDKMDYEDGNISDETCCNDDFETHFRDPASPSIPFERPVNSRREDSPVSAAGNLKELSRTDCLSEGASPSIPFERPVNSRREDSPVSAAGNLKELSRTDCLSEGLETSGNHTSNALSGKWIDLSNKHEKNDKETNNKSDPEEMLQNTTSTEETHQRKVEQEKKKERKFILSFRQFSDMMRVDMKDRQIKWQNKKIDLYLFYQAVQEKGGYTKVSTNKHWKTLCNNFLGTKSSCNFVALKNSYKKLLLPFENYLRKLNIETKSESPACLERNQNEKCNSQNVTESNSEGKDSTDGNDAAWKETSSKRLRKTIQKNKAVTPQVFTNSEISLLKSEKVENNNVLNKKKGNQENQKENINNEINDPLSLSRILEEEKARHESQSEDDDVILSLMNISRKSQAVKIDIQEHEVLPSPSLLEDHDNGALAEDIISSLMDISLSCVSSSEEKRNDAISSRDSSINSSYHLLGSSDTFFKASYDSRTQEVTANTSSSNDFVPSSNPSTPNLESMKRTDNDSGFFTQSTDELNAALDQLQCLDEELLAMEESVLTNEFYDSKEYMLQDTNLWELKTIPKIDSVNETDVDDIFNELENLEGSIAEFTSFLSSESFTLDL